MQEASYYGYAGMLPSKYTRAVMLGEAFSGLLVSINRVITKLTIENNLTNTIIFFTLSIIGEIVSLTSVLVEVYVFYNCINCITESLSCNNTRKNSSTALGPITDKSESDARDIYCI